jgi:hypothetical protein
VIPNVDDKYLSPASITVLFFILAVSMLGLRIATLVVINGDKTSVFAKKS